MSGIGKSVLALLAGIIAGGALAADITVSRESAGPVIAQRGRWLYTPALNLPLPAQSRILLTGWFYQLSRAAPAGFEAQLCRGSSCISLDAARGTTDGFNGNVQQGRFRMRFRIAGGALITPGLRVISSGVRVSYRLQGVSTVVWLSQPPWHWRTVTCVRRF